MAKYRKKPIVIEAVEVARVIDADNRSVPVWALAALHDGTIRVHYSHHADPCLLIKTLEGEMCAELGDMLICGVKGELYPCKPDIFAATYEAA